MAYLVSGNIPAKILSQVLLRDDYICQRCKITKEEGARLEVHHKIRRKDGGTHDPSNLITLCVPCHRDEDRDRTKPHYEVMIELTWEEYEKLKPLYIERKMSGKKLLSSVIKRWLEKC